MPKRCSVALCKNYQVANCEQSFFHFPKDPALCKLWISRCNRESVDIKEGRICSDHFEVDQFEDPQTYGSQRRKRLLKLDAVPSLLVHLPQENGALDQKETNKTDECFFVANGVYHFYEPDECSPEMIAEEANAQAPREFCIIDGCPNRSIRPEREAEFLRFPKDTARKKQWIQACNKKSKFNADKSRICSNHFSAEDFKIPKFRSRRERALGKKRKLKKTAIPSLNIPNSENSEEVFENVILLDPDSIPPAVHELCEESGVLWSCNQEAESSVPVQNPCSSDVQKTLSSQEELMLEELSSPDTFKMHQVSLSPQETNQESTKTVSKERKPRHLRKLEEASRRKELEERLKKSVDMRDVFAQSKIQDLLEENSKLKRKLKASEDYGRKMNTRVLCLQEKSQKLTLINKTIKKRLAILEGQLKKSKREIKTPSGEIEVGMLYPV